MQPSPAARTQNFINRIQTQAVSIQKKTSMHVLLKEISVKPNIACLNIQHCQAEGNLDAKTFGLKNLKKITINNCPNISQIYLPEECLQNLQHLELTENKIKNFPQILFQCPNLTHLNLSNNLIQKLPGNPFNNMSRLKILAVYGNPLLTIDLQLYNKLGVEGLLFEWKIDILGGPEQGRLSTQYCSYSQNMGENHVSELLDLKNQMQCAFARYDLKDQLSAGQQEQIKILVSYEHLLFFSNILPKLNLQECYQLLTLCRRSHKNSFFNPILKRIGQFIPQQNAESSQKGQYIFQRLLSLNISHIFHHKASLQVLKLKNIIDFLNQISFPSENQQKRQQFIAFIKNPLIKYHLLNQAINCDEALLCFCSLISNKSILSQLILHNCIPYIQSCRFDNYQLIKQLLQMENWELLKSLLSNPSFKYQMFNGNVWKLILKPKTITYKLLLREEKRYVEETVSNARFLHFPEYKPPKSYMLRNDVHDYKILKSYEEFQASFQRKDFKIMVRYANKQNSFSIAGKIRRQINFKNQALTQRREGAKRKLGIRVTNSDCRNFNNSTKSLSASQALGADSLCSAPFSTRFCNENSVNLANSLVIQCSEFDTEEI